MEKLQGRVLTLPKLSGSIGAKVINLGGKPYDGEYVVDPKFTAQQLPTSGTTLNKDLTVNAIAVNKTANAAGGNTIVIGV